MSELFLAEAAVRVRANTATFRDELILGVEKAIKEAEALAKVRVTPIVASATGAGATAGAAEQAAASKVATNAFREQAIAAGNLAKFQEEQTLAATRSGVAAKSQAFASREQIALSNSLATASKAVALSQEEIVGASSAAAAAQIHFTRVQAASAAVSSAAQKLANQAFLTGNVEALKLAATMQILAANEEQEALAALGSARAHVSQAASLSQAGRGAGSTALSMLGLRGATLAATAPFIAAAAGFITFAKSVSLAAGLQKELNVFRVTAEATAGEMNRVAAAARKLGADITLPAVSANEAANAMTELAKAGLSVDSSIAAARGTLQLATAANIDNADAVNIVASALNAFGLSGKNAIQVADLLANASIQAQGSIADLGQGLLNVAPVARQVGLSVGDTVDLLTLLAKNGIQGANAGTVLRVALLRLVAPTKAVQTELGKLGVNIRDSQGNLKPTLFADLGAALSRLATPEQQRVLAEIFGERGIRGAAILAREGTDSLNKISDANRRAGAAAKIAGAQTQGLSGDIENLKNQLGNLGLTIGTASIPLISGLAKIFARAAGDANFLAEGIGALGKRLGLIATSKDVPNTVAGLSTALSDAQAELDKFLASGGKEEQTSTLRKNIADLQDQLLKLQGTVGQTDFLKAIADASPLVRTAIEDGVISPTERAQLEADALGRAYVLGLDQAKSAAESFGPTIRKALEIGQDEVDKAARKIRGQLSKALLVPLHPIQVRLGKIGEQLDKAVASGNTDRELRLLRDRAKELNNAVDAANKAAQKAAGGPGFQKAVAERRKAQAELAQVEPRIRDIENQIIADQDAARRKREEKAKQADQAVLDAFVPKQNRLDLRAIEVGGSDNLKAQLALQKAIANEASREFAIIDKTVKDKKTRDAALAERVKTLVTAGTNITSLLKQIGVKAKDRAAAALQAVRDLDEARLQLAQLRLGPEGQGKDAVVAAFDKVIADARKQRDATKRGSLARAQAEIALQQFINDRRDFMNGLEKNVKDANQGTTAFDLLKQFADTFNQNAGNLIGPNQPFAGPTGFTADIAQFLVRRPGTKTTAAPPAAKTPIELNDDRLVRSIDRLADVIEGKVAGNSSTATAATFGGVQQGSLAERFLDATRARKVRESGV